MKKKYLLLWLVFLLFINSCSEEKKYIVKKYYNTSEVKSGNLESIKNFVWYTDSFDNIVLWAKIWWKVVSMNKEVGDSVRDWEIIRTLDWIEAKTWYNSSENIINQLNLLKNLTSETYDKQILQAEEKLKQIQNWIDMANIWVSWSNNWLNDIKNITEEQLKTASSQIEQAQIWLETAKTNLENNKNILKQKEEDIYNNSKNAIENANVVLSNIIDFLDNLYGVTNQNKYKNDSYEIYLWAKNTTLKTNWENELRYIISKKEEVINLKTDSKENIENTLKEYNNLFSNELRNILKNTYKVMENSISSSSFSDATINTYKTQITWLQWNLEKIILTVSWNYFLWLKWSIDNIENFKKESKNQIDMLEKQVSIREKQIDTLKQTYNQYKAQWNWQVTDINTKKQISEKQKELAQNQLSEAKLAIETLKKQKESSLKQIDAEISQVKASQNDASVMIENTKIISPISWIITKKLSEIWQIVWPGTPIYNISTNNEIKVVIWVDEETKKIININDKVKIEINWLSWTLTWEIVNILPTIENITKKQNIEIKINNSQKNIKIWEYVKVFIENKKNVSENENIVIDNKAILQNFWIPWVYVLEEKDWKKIVKFKNIEILNSNDYLSEVKWLLTEKKIFLIEKYWSKNIL